MKGIRIIISAVTIVAGLFVSSTHSNLSHACSQRPSRAAAAPVTNNEPVLIKATFFSHTNDDNKDHDTGIYVKVRSSDGSTLISHADNRDNSGDDGTEYKDGSDHQFDLDLDAPGLEKSSAGGFRVQVCQHTHGHDTWKFNGRVVLFFSDKSNLVKSRDGIELKNDGACTDF